MSKCESCRKGYNGRNGNGYMPCGCKPKSKIDNTDLNNLLQKAIEAKPEFVEPGNVRRPSNHKNILNLNISLKLLE